MDYKQLHIQRYNSFYQSIEKQDFRFAKWIIDVLNPQNFLLFGNPNDDNDPHILKVCLKKLKNKCDDDEKIEKTLSIATWLVQKFDIQHGPFFNVRDEIYDAIIAQNPKLVNWYFDFFPIYVFSSSLRHWGSNLFKQCLEHQNAPKVAKVFYKHIPEIMHYYFSKDIAQLLQGPCLFQNVECLEWVVDTFNIDNGTLVSNLFEYACNMNYLTIVQ